MQPMSKLPPRINPSKLSQAIEKRVSEMMTKAVAAIVLDDPFYGYMLLRRPIVFDSSIPTAATNGVNIFVNPVFINTMTLPQLKGLLKHEIMHIAHMHHLRRGNRDVEKWNIACDKVINAHLKKAGVELPEGGLIDESCSEFSAEHVYNTLPDMPPGNGPGPGNGGGGFPPPWNFGAIQDHPDATSEPMIEQIEEETKSDVIQAANTAKMMGKEPAGLDRLIDKIRQSKLPWKKLLAKLFRVPTKVEDSWNRPNRRYLASGVYLPSPHGYTMGPVVVGVDTSGSITSNELEMYFGEINAILKHVRPESIHVVYCDAAISNTQKLTVKDLPLKVETFKPKGGGGTDFRPVFDYVAQNKLKPALFLYLTDMYGYFPDKAPSYPVIWCATTDVKAPFGKTLEIS